MKTVLDLVTQRKSKLAHSPFCQWLGTANPQKEDPFSFTPAMLYFVLGFKDILASLKTRRPKNIWEHMINMHCDEDANHWLWYLRDLETLGFRQSSWGTKWTDVFKTLWADENYDTREMVYLCIHLIRQHQNPFISLAIIESLEAAFGVFIEGVKFQAQRCNVYESLEYFGKTHNDKEHDHSLGHWIEGHHENTELAEQELPEEERRKALQAVDQVFDQFEKIFKNWYSHRESFRRDKQPIWVESALPKTIEAEPFL